MSTASAKEQRILLGTSREGREIFGYRFGSGALSISLVAGAHADEPVGPALLDRLVEHLAGLPGDSPLLRLVRWSLVPHINPDGDARNAAWSEPATTQNESYDLAMYLRHVVRELPGDDIEFGYPNDAEDRQARPENLAVAAFLREEAPYALHASLHGMGFAAGPWFLMERSWADRTEAMRENLRQLVRKHGYRIHDIDRGGEKGFHRIDEGFTSRPDSRAMRKHFEDLGDTETAQLFRPSSMEMVRSFGGDPLTLVTEMPLFLTPPAEAGDDLIRPRAVRELRAATGRPGEEVAQLAQQLGVRPMPIRDQMLFQLAFLNEALKVVSSREEAEEIRLEGVL